MTSPKRLRWMSREFRAEFTSSSFETQTRSALIDERRTNRAEVWQVNSKLWRYRVGELRAWRRICQRLGL